MKWREKREEADLADGEDDDAKAKTMREILKLSSSVLES